MKTNTLFTAGLSGLALVILSGHSGGSCGSPPPPHCDQLAPESCVNDPSCELVAGATGKWSASGAAACRAACACPLCLSDTPDCTCDCVDKCPPELECRTKRPCDELDEGACGVRSECRALYSRRGGGVRPLPMDEPAMPWPGSETCREFGFLRCEAGPTCPALACAVMCAPGYRLALDANGCDTCSCEPIDPTPCPAVMCLIACPDGSHVKDATGCDTCECEPSECPKLACAIDVDCPSGTHPPTDERGCLTCGECAPDPVSPQPGCAKACTLSCAAGQVCVRIVDHISGKPMERCEAFPVLCAAVDCATEECQCNCLGTALCGSKPVCCGAGPVVECPSI